MYKSPKGHTTLISVVIAVTSALVAKQVPLRLSLPTLSLPPFFPSLFTSLSSLSFLFDSPKAQPPALNICPTSRLICGWPLFRDFFCEISALFRGKNFAKFREI